MGEILAFLAENDGGKWSRKNIFEILPCAHHVIFITKFVLLIKTPLFYEVNSFNRKWLAHGGISKIIILDHFSQLFFGQNFTHIPF